MDEETAYENRPFDPRPLVPRDMVEDLQASCEALWRLLRTVDPQTDAEVMAWQRIEDEVAEIREQMIWLWEGSFRGQH